MSADLAEAAGNDQPGWRGYRWHLGAFLLFAVLVALRHFLTPFFHCNAECATVINEVGDAGYSWRLTHIFLFNKLGFHLFGPWWPGYFMLCGAVFLATACLAYLFWVAYAPVLWPGRGSALLGRRAGLATGALLILLHYFYITDVTSLSFGQAGMFSLLAMLCTARYARSGRVGWWLGALAAYALACATNALAWLLPPVLLALELLAWPAGARLRRLPWAAVRLAVMFGLLTAFVVLQVGAEEVGQRMADVLEGGLKPEDGARPLLLSSLAYKVIITPGLFRLGFPNPAPGIVAYLAEALFWLAGLWGLARLLRGKPHGVLTLHLLFALLWLLLVTPQLLGAGGAWWSKVHRFPYLRVGLALLAGALAALCLGWLARRLTGRARLLVPDLALLALVAVGAGLAGVWEGAFNLVRPRTWQLPAACARARACPDGAPTGKAGKYGPCSDLSYRDMQNEDLSGMDLGRSMLTGVRLTNGEASEVNLEESCAYWADLSFANFSDALMARAELVGATLNRSMLMGADLRGAYLRGASLRQSDLRGANLQGADLHKAWVHGADLRGANLSRAKLLGVEFQGANLSGADLRGADVRFSNLQGARLKGARVEGALFCLGQRNSLMMAKGKPRLVECPAEPPASALWPAPRAPLPRH